MSPTEKLVEKMARAIGAAFGVEWHNGVVTCWSGWRQGDTGPIDVYFRAAKAALTTIPSPSEEEIAGMIEQSLMSPASGPVDWSVPGRYEASKKQAARLAKAILKRVKGE